MDLTLPCHRDNRPADILHLADCHCFVIIGANGAGKTRFTSAIIESLGPKAFRLSALDALYGRVSSPDAIPAALRDRLAPQVLGNLDKSPALLELLLQQLMHDEMVNLISYKLALADKREAKLKRTRLDRVIELWQEVFPDNRMLIDSGKILFARGADVDNYSAYRLSDGERAVLYYAAAVLYAPSDALIFVDSPEIFLHPTLTISLWNRLEATRPDCTFCYTTHDPEFASSRNGAPVVWVRDYDPANAAWDYDVLPDQSEISQELYMTLVGARKPVLFIEGDSRRSIDAKLYPLIFPDYTVQSLGSCNKVIEATRTFNDLATFHKMDSFGIVDRDRRDDTEVAYLRRKRIMVPEVAEVENIMLI
ncbi:MAG: AAA family ATPase, partial [Muribaculaceae bacterium]|nr:AAA family ATPase [Muribaculaceae bacterium]